MYTYICISIYVCVCVCDIRKRSSLVTEHVLFHQADIPSPKPPETINLSTIPCSNMFQHHKTTLMTLIPT